MAGLFYNNEGIMKDVFWGKYFVLSIFHYLQKVTVVADVSK